MDENEKEQIRLHSAGATVRHTPPFSHLVSHHDAAELDQPFIDQWVIPYYMKIEDLRNLDWVSKIKEIQGEITREIVLTLLGNFNWRPRLVGAYFSAVKGFDEQIQIIGTHFLKSEVCCVGHIYALVLAFLNTQESRNYLDEYLNYYLQRPDLYFDQSAALTAVAYLDKVNGTRVLDRHAPNWREFLRQRALLEKEKAMETAKMIEQAVGKEESKKYLESVSELESREFDVNTDYLEKQIELLRELRTYCNEQSN